MARSFKERRFTGRSDLGEDVNPSNYIVNLADCMLVLAVGFMVALISHWGVDLSAFEEINDEDLEQVEEQDVDVDALTNGSYYVEAGTAYRDPVTGNVYILQQGAEEDAASDEQGQSGASDSEASQGEGADEGQAAGEDANSSKASSFSEGASSSANTSKSGESD